MTAEKLPFVVTGLKVVFFLLVLNVLRLLLSARGKPVSGKSPVPRRLALTFGLLVVPLFIAVYAYQATWQLTGFMRPKFCDFIRRYDRRHTNAARAHDRGRIRDANGIMLAKNERSTHSYRVYPHGQATCHVVGYENDRFGKNGVERADDDALSGRSLTSAQQLDRFGRNVIDRRQIVGNDLDLTLDIRLQQKATELLAGKRGAAVVMRPGDGAILALVSAPSFDPNALTAAQFSSRDPAAPMFNRALYGLYPPGSTFKIVMAALAVERGFKSRLDCPAEGFAAARGARPIRDHEYYAYEREGRRWRGHGRLDLREAFAHSSNVFFAQLGVQYGPGALNEVNALFRFGERLTVFQGSTGEIRAKASSVPKLGGKDLRKTAQLSIGQGQMLVTPLHMAWITSVIANDGVGMQPRLNKATPAASLGRVVAPETALHVQSIMRHAVERGTGHSADVPGLGVGGKTGTAQAPSGDDHSWFTCFSPYPRPKLVVTVIVENGGYGSKSALPVAQELLLIAAEHGLMPVHGEAGAQ